jgi:hypothetical protein
MGDQPPPKLTEGGVIEAGIGQLQAEQVFPIDATAHGTPKNCGSSGCLSCFLTPRISVECRIPATESGRKSSVRTRVWTYNSRWAPRGLQGICCCFTIRLLIT